MPEGLVTFGEGRDRSFIYAENIVKERPPEEGEGSLPEAIPELDKPPAD
jgi:penicillin-binding protein 1A